MWFIDCLGAGSFCKVVGDRYDFSIDVHVSRGFVQTHTSLSYRKKKTIKDFKVGEST